MMLPSGVDLTLTELQEMATRQQRQIEEQQQMLVAKEQRLKFLKQQELRHQQIASENERLRKLREKVEAQELKLKKLRALRGQVNEQKTTNNTLSSELEAIKALFNEKEKELSLAVSRVDDLSQQLEALRQGRINGLQQGEANNNHPALQELTKLRKEVVIRNKLNEQQNSKLAAHREILQQRKQEMASMDARIAELQQRLRSKKQAQCENQKQANRNHSNNILSSQGINKPGWGGNVAAVEPYRVQHPDPGNQPMSKQDPKYQSLPYNVKFPDPNKENRASPIPPHMAKPLVKPATGFVPGSQNVTPTNSANTAAQASPSILYASGESPGSPKTSTPVAGNQSDRGNNKEIFITDAPVVSKPIVAAHARTGSYTGPERVAEIKTGVTQPHRLSPSTLGVPAPQHRKQGSNDSTTQRHTPDYVSHQALGQHHRQGSAEYTSHAALSQHTRQGSSEYVTHKSLPQHAKQSSDDYTAQKGLTRHSKQGSEDAAGQKTVMQGRSESAGVLPGTNREPPLPRQAQSDSNLTGNQASSQQPNSKPYRYASHDVIASTYMGKTNPSAIDQYKKNVTQFYKEFKGTMAEEGGKKQEGMIVALETESAKQIEGQVGKEGTPSQIAEGLPPVYNIDPELSRYGGKPNAPRPLRRRLSSGGESPEAHLPKIRTLQEDTDTKPIETPAAAPVDSSSEVPSKPSIHQPDLVRVDVIQKDSSGSDEDNKPVFSEEDIPVADDENTRPATKESLPVALRRRKGNLKSKNSTSRVRRVSFDPLALLLDAALEGELELVIKSAHEVSDPSCPNDEGITALHNAICAGHYDIVKFLVEYGCDVNSPDSDGWTPLHCAASCNNLPMVQMLVEHGACILATTISDQETAAEKCEEDEDGYQGCSQYLYNVQEKLGIANKGLVYAVFDFEGENQDELLFKNGDALTVVRKGDEKEKEWWWAKRDGKYGYIPRNLMGMYPRVKPKWLSEEKRS